MIPNKGRGDCRGTLRVESSLRHGDDCTGEALVLRFVSEDIGQVVASERCHRRPSAGCDGTPYFQPGDLVGLPPGWRWRPERPLQAEELWPLPGFQRGNARKG